jgi:hypothetical protein
VVAQRIMRGEVDLTGVPPWLAPWVEAAMSVAPGERPPPAALAAAMAGAGTPPTVVAIEAGPVLDDGTGGPPPTPTVVIADVGPDGLATTRPDVGPTVPLAGPRPGTTAAAPGAPARHEPTRVYLAGDAPAASRRRGRRGRARRPAPPPRPHRETT